MKPNIFPYPPILSSKELAWDDIICEDHNQPPGRGYRPAIPENMLTNKKIDSGELSEYEYGKITNFN